jgi:hypothetical protein
VRCKAGHEMVVRERFRFDHEPGDTPRDTESLRMFKAMGVELGTEVTLWYCEACDFALAEFEYEGAPGGA